MASDWNDDEYVANLLKQDAKKAAKTYELVGINAFKHQRKSAAPKPNTSFLRHIIRQTDSHNAALLAKEAEDSNARLQKMNQDKRRERRWRDDQKGKTDGRLTPVLSDDDTNNRLSKRRNKNGENDNDHGTASRGRRRDGPRQGTYTAHRDRSWDKRRDKRHHRDSDEDRPAPKHRHKYNSENQPDKAREKEDRDHRRRRHRSTSRSSSRSRSYRSHEHKKRDRCRDRSRNRSRSPRGSRRKSPSACIDDARKVQRHSILFESDSDPLESLIGPLPLPATAAVEARGRGAHKVNTKSIDSRFSTHYDPTTDMRPKSDAEDDWGDAVEAFRDHQRWKQQGAARLKAAGFTEAQIKKWEKGDAENEDDVVWAEKGQAREWDRGKIADSNGDITLKADFGRLK